VNRIYCYHLVIADIFDDYFQKCRNGLSLDDIDAII